MSRKTGLMFAITFWSSVGYAALVFTGLPLWVHAGIVVIIATFGFLGGYRAGRHDGELQTLGAVSVIISEWEQEYEKEKEERERAELRRHRGASRSDTNLP